MSKKKKKNKKSFWNHRVLVHFYGETPEFKIHEVFYKDGKPISYGEKGECITASSIKDLKWTLKHMKRCLKLPVLLADGFPKEYKK